MSEITAINNRGKSTSKKEQEELFIDTAEAEHIEMYLKAIWSSSERKEEVKVSSIAKLLDVTQPSVVQMLHKLNDAGLVAYKGGKNVVELTNEGEKIGKQMIRNTKEIYRRIVYLTQASKEMPPWLCNTFWTML